MRIERHSDGASFLESAGHLLLRAEAENNLILGVSAGIGPQEANSDIYLGVVLENRDPVACAMRTPPHRVVVNAAPTAYLDTLASDLLDAYEELPGVMGPVDAAYAFAEAWVARRPSTVTTAVSMRIYLLDRVQTPASMIPGRMRVIEVEDLDLLVEWMSAFGRDTHVGAVDSDVRAAAQHRIDERSVFIWEDGGAVSMVAHSGPTPNGIRIVFAHCASSRR